MCGLIPREAWTSLKTTKCFEARTTALSETLIFNTALIRRRVRDTKLTMYFNASGNEVENRYCALLS